MMPVRSATRLPRGVLSLSQIIGSTLANIGPALGVIFGFGLITQAAGVATPITIATAMLAVLFLCNTLAQFSRVSPSAGSFVTFIGMAFGPAAGAAASLFVVVGYCIAGAAIVAIAGSWVHDFLALYVHLSVPWPVISLAATLGVILLVSRGIGLSTRWATVFFAFEVALLCFGAAALLWAHHGQMSLAPLRWSRMSGGLRGLGLGFPFAIYLFVGWENSAMLAEETDDPRRNVPRALFVGTTAVGLLYLFITYAIVTAYGNAAGPLAAAESPFVQALAAVAPWLRFVIYCAGLTSLLSCLIGLTNGQARILFNSAREGMLPPWFGRVDPVHGTPTRAIAVFLGGACAIVLAYSPWTGPIAVFNQTGTLGTIVLILTYMMTNLALPAYMWRRHRAGFAPFAHLVVPLGGTALMLVPLWGLIQPGQPAPYNVFPWLALGFLVVCIGYGVMLARRRPELAARIGSFVADADR